MYLSCLLVILLVNAVHTFVRFKSIRTHAKLSLHEVTLRTLSAGKELKTPNQAAFKPLKDILVKHNVSSNKIDIYIKELICVGFPDSQAVATFSADFELRPEILSDILQKDFGFKAYDAHILRVALSQLLVSEREDSRASAALNLSQNTSDLYLLKAGSSYEGLASIDNLHDYLDSPKALDRSITTRVRPSKVSRDRLNYTYSILPFRSRVPIIIQELDEYLIFMTESSTQSQETCIRHATAEIYLRHANLLIGWFVSHHLVTPEDDDIMVNGKCILLKDLSIRNIFPTAEKDSATVVYDYLKWLRQKRKISLSYESSMLRGLLKLAKFRYAKESTIDITYGGKSFDDIPVVRELRKLHREAFKMSSKSPRVSDESLKWISWDEYLGVIYSMKEELESLLKYYYRHPYSVVIAQITADVSNLSKQDLKSLLLEESSKGEQQISITLDGKTKKELRLLLVQSRLYTLDIRLSQSELESYSIHEGIKTAEIMQRDIANKFQEYLLFAFFSNVPDRQRTFRELVIGTTFIKDELCWQIKHGPDDYKTGKTYGARPPLMLAASLTKAIDDYIQHWRPHLGPLGPKSDHFFIQPRTGNALKFSDIFRIITKVCHVKTGKNTNPHLLRDMIVTHVRNTDATEKELEALALYMGHSIQMQRTSYDRRTLNEKVAPAVNMLLTIATKGSPGAA